MKKFKMIMEIIGLSVLINENTDFCSFVYFSGHINKLDIRISQSKEDTENRLYSIGLYYETDFISEEMILNSLEDAKNVLTGYLYGNVVDFTGAGAREKMIKLKVEMPTPAATEVG